MEDGMMEGRRVNVVDPMKAQSGAYENLLPGGGGAGSWPDLWPLCRLEIKSGSCCRDSVDGRITALPHPSTTSTTRSTSVEAVALICTPFHLQLAHMQLKSV